jgi:Ca2+-binding RTX toxin-like protein
VGGAGADALRGGDDIDTVSYATSSAAVSVNLLTNVAGGGHASGDSFSDIENVIGTRFEHDTLIGNGRNNNLYGGGGFDTLSGAAGNDILIGGEDRDLLQGGIGFDAASYASSGAGVIVSLAIGAGTGGDADGDTLTEIEDLIGSDHADILTGDSRNNVLSGGLGNDVLDGGFGFDTFLFDSALGAANVDRITDFTGVEDTVRLDNEVFTALTITGELSATAFASGAAAGDADDRIIYDSANGALYYDADGIGAAEQIRFATLAGAPRGLTHADFLVV